ncbi:hypothetical protein AGMMS50293_13230 [Spirochaetia bacterium]|nr:hypothetical protein AGMMS50293_13230 [Spirochaetia bacterium]
METPEKEKTYSDFPEAPETPMEELILMARTLGMFCEAGGLDFNFMRQKTDEDFYKELERFFKAVQDNHDDWDPSGVVSECEEHYWELRERIDAEKKTR